MVLGFGSIGTSESAESIPSSIGFTHMGPPREPELSLRDRPPSPKKSARQTLYMVERRSVKGAAGGDGGPAPGTPRPSVLDLLDDSVAATLHTLGPSCCFRPSLLSCLILHLFCAMETVTSDTVLVLVCVRPLFLLFGIRATRKAAYVPHLAQPWLAAILMLTCLLPVPKATWGGVVGDSEGTNTDPLLMIAHAAALGISGSISLC